MVVINMTTTFVSVETDQEHFFLEIVINIHCLLSYLISFFGGVYMYYIYNNIWTTIKEGKKEQQQCCIWSKTMIKRKYHTERERTTYR